MGARADVTKSALDEGDAPERSIPFNFDMSCSPDLEPLVELLGRQIPSKRPSYYPGTKAAIDILLANLIRAYQCSPQCFVAISLNRNVYTRTRYRPNAPGYRAVIKALDFLVDHTTPLCSYWPGFNDRRPGGVGKNARIKASGFLRLLLRRYGLYVSYSKPVTSSIFNRLRPAPLNALDGRLPDSWVVSRPAPELIRLKTRGKGLSEYCETPATIAARGRLTTWNNFLRRYHHVDLIKSDEEIQNLHLYGDHDDEDDEFASYGDEVDRPRYVQFEKNTLYRVFNNGSFDEGGRFYGGWWQRIPSEARRYITINDNPTLEFDYANLHAAMAYATEGLPLLEDAYLLPGLERRYRKLVKTTFFKLISAVGKVRGPNKDRLPPGYTWETLQAAIMDKHSAIAKYFNSGVGLKLQRVDSEIAEDVMMALMAKDLLALPVHDSFLVAGMRGTILEEMQRAYRARMKQHISVDADPTFLELEHQSQSEDTETPDIELEVEWRSHLPGYEGFQQRRSDFLRKVPSDWSARMGPARDWPYPKI